jgi:hypothetical protein
VSNSVENFVGNSLDFCNIECLASYFGKLLNRDSPRTGIDPPPYFSDPRKWTPETVKDLIIPDLDLGEADANYIACKTVADAHNAALAAEREMANQVLEQVRASYEISKQLRETPYSGKR